MKRVLAVSALILLLSYVTAYAFETGNVEIHGFASTGYLDSTDYNYLGSSNKGTFEFNEGGINFAASLSDDIRVGLQFYTFDLGDVGNNDVELDWAFLDYQWREWLGFMVGKVKKPAGLYSEYQDYDMLRTAILLPQSVYNIYEREAMISVQGLSIYGTTSLGSAGSLRYDAYMGSSNIDDDQGMARVIARAGMDLDNAEMEYIAGIRFKWETPLEGLTLATTLQQYDMDYNATMQSAFGPTIVNIALENEVPQGRHYWYSAEYVKNNLTIAAEYKLLKADVSVTGDVSVTPNPVDIKEKRELNYEGYYGLISYRFTDWLETGVYYSAFYVDKTDRDGSEQLMRGDILVDHQAWQKDIALSFRFDITDFWLVKLEAHYMDGTALATQTEAPEVYDDDNWTLFAVKTTFNF